MIGQFNALILAGSRGPQDPIATLAGVTHKALAPIAGQTMLARVIAAVRAGGKLDKLFVCIDENSLPRSADWTVIPPGPSPAASVASALDRTGVAQPLLITTADHPLLTGEMIAHFLNHIPADADLAVALADETTIRRAYPDNKRTYYRLGGMGYSGCNLFLARNAKAKDVAEYWRRMEGKRKNPLAIAGAVGFLAVIRFALGWLSLDAAFAHVSRLTGAKIRPVVMPFAEAAIDVDKPADYELVNSILKRREAAS